MLFDASLRPTRPRKKDSKDDKDKDEGGGGAGLAVGADGGRPRRTGGGTPGTTCRESRL